MSSSSNLDDDNGTLKLYYWNLRARGEILRCMLQHSRLEWEDCVVARKDWEADKYDFLPAGKTGEKLLPVLSITDSNGNDTTLLPESHDIARWIAERCEPTLLGQTPEMEEKCRKVWEYVDVAQDIIDPILNWFSMKETEEKIHTYLQEMIEENLLFLTREIGEGPYLCGADLSYADFIIFHLLDNMCTLFGEENVLEKAAVNDTLRTFYDKMYRLPAVSGRMMERPLAGREAVGQQGSILYSSKSPSRLGFIQNAWKEKFGNGKK
ncbi:MAG: hypothetical protein SGILL_006228 [Bacillariaceae sp.]